MAVEGAADCRGMEDGSRLAGRPLVSVVIPVHNQERFLGDAIRSVLAQTYDAVECIVVDDGSSDDRATVARSLGVEVVRKPNAGVASARSAGVAASTGPLVAFLDADDYWLPEKLEMQVRCWSRTPSAGMVYTGFSVVRHGSDRHLYRVIATDPANQIRAATLLDGPGIGFGITALLARSAIASLGPFDERLSISADVAYAWGLLQRLEVLAVPDPLAVYRLHTRTQMHNDLALLEHDRLIVTNEAFAAGTFEHSRATANLHTHLAYRRLMRGDVRRALTHGRAALDHEPGRLPAVPLAAADRRLRRKVRSLRQGTTASMPARSDGAARPPVPDMQGAPWPN